MENSSLWLVAFSGLSALVLGIIIAYISDIIARDALVFVRLETYRRFKAVIALTFMVASLIRIGYESSSANIWPAYLLFFVSAGVLLKVRIYHHNIPEQLNSDEDQKVEEVIYLYQTFFIFSAITLFLMI